MSQSRVSASELQSRDWMRELEADAKQVEAVLTRLDELAMKGAMALRLGDFRQAVLRFEEIREGLRLVCELTGVKIQA